MRKLTSFEDPGRARALQAALRAEDIPSELRPDGSDLTYGVWIVVEEQLLDAKQLLSAFLTNPNAARFDNARRQMAEPRAAGPARSAQARPAQRRVVRGRETFGQRALQAPVTATLVLAAAAVLLLDYAGFAGATSQYLSIASYRIIDGFARSHGYSDILHGQIWRLFTPVLLHFGLFHLLFNAMWMLDIGAAVERFQGSRQYAAFIVGCAVASNLAQFQLGFASNFGGLSGVVYALVGYVWARGRFDPTAGIGMPPRLMTFFVFWMVLGFTGLIERLVGSMANYCHLGGLASGAAYGYVAARRATHLLRR